MARQPRQRPLFSGRPRPPARRTEGETSVGRSGVGPIIGDTLDQFLHWNERVEITSSNIEAAQYDESSKELTIWYLAKANSPGSCYLYRNVTTAMAHDFITSTSKGKWRHEHLPNSWDYSRIS